ncbi:MAG: sulfatase [Verrucomicrobiales bacterium]|nr:sulfatase [Verrucomicrobiales bacterium]
MKAIALFGLLTAALLSQATAADKRPHIVVILVDDLRWDELGCTGHPFSRTPNIDRIANEGARFRNAFCTTPLCSPSRASLLTGLHTRRHGILDNINRSEQSHRLETFPKMLHEADYETAYIGKWHMGNDDTARPGFDHWVCLQGQGTSFDPVLNENGTRTQNKGHTTDVLNSRAVDFISQKRDKPFCLYLAHKALHPELVQRDDGSITDPKAARFLPAKRHEDWFKSDAIPRRLNVIDDLAGKPALARDIEGKPPLSRETGTSDETVRDRLRMLAGVDDGVGMIFDALEKFGELDNTVIILTSDHGYWYGEHGLSVERRLAYEEGLRIPLLVRHPATIKSGQLIDKMALTIDLAPTVLDMTGVSGGEQLDGRSLVPLLRGEAPDDWRESFQVEYNTDTVFPRVFKMGYRAIRTEKWKLIRYKDLSGMDELYNLIDDPYELENLINSDAVKPVMAELDRKLD